MSTTSTSHWRQDIHGGSSDDVDISEFPISFLTSSSGHAKLDVEPAEPATVQLTQTHSLIETLGPVRQQSPRKKPEIIAYFYFKIYCGW